MPTVSPGSTVAVTLPAGATLTMSGQGNHQTAPPGNNGEAYKRLTLINTQAQVIGPYAVTITVNVSADSTSISGVNYSIQLPYTSTIPAMVLPTQAASGDTLYTVVGSNLAPTSYQWTRNGTAISGATGANYTLTSADTGSVVTCTIGGIPFTPNSASVRYKYSSNPTPVVPSIGGQSIGVAGTGTYAGFTLLAGDDFNTLPTRWNGGSSVVAQYASSTPQGGQRHLTDQPYRMLMVDPAYRGWTSASPTALAVDPLSVSSSVLTITTSPTPSSLYSYLPTDYTLGDGNGKPLLVSGCLDTWPSMMVSAAGDFIFEGKIQLSAAVARGWWPSFWTTTIVNWPNEGEIDVMEARKASSGAITNYQTLHENTADGQPDSNIAIANRSIPGGQFVTYIMKKQGTTLTFMDDSTGTMTVSGTYTGTIVSRLRGAHRFRMEQNVTEAWDSSTFTIGDWPVSMSIDWWRCWVANAQYAPFVAHTILPAVSTTPGGSWAATFPAAASLYGTTPDIETIVGAFDNPDCPGQATKTTGTTGGVPGGMTIDAVGRTISGTVPSDRGGATGILFAGSFAVGGQARAAIKMFNVAPAAQGTLFSNFTASAGASVSQTVAYTDFHSGNLGPHSYSVSFDSGSGLSASYGTNNQTVTITGTAPASGTFNINVTATNAIGQATTATRTLTVSSLYSFSDNFNRANATLANANWTLVTGAVGTANIVSQVLQYTGSDTIGALYTAPDIGSQRQYTSGTAFGGIAGFFVLQATDANNYFGIRRNPTSNVVEVYSRVSGTLTLQASFTQTAGDADVIRLEYIGTTLTAKLNGTAITPTGGAATLVSGGPGFTPTAVPAASTKTGMLFRLNANINYFDNFAAGAL